jgi:hypothetical protein
MDEENKPMPSEKPELERIETNHSPTPSELELQKEQTLRYVDLENKHAFKGDDSDGKVEWTIRKVLHGNLGSIHPINVMKTSCSPLLSWPCFTPVHSLLSCLSKLAHSYRSCRPRSFRGFSQSK